MISEPTAFPAATRILAGTSPLPIGRQQLAVLGGVLRQAAISMRDWTQTPALPYAALWEGSVVAGMLHEPTDFEPDPFTTDMPFLKDVWPRG